MMEEIKEILEADEEKEWFEHHQYLSDYLMNSLRFMYEATDLNPSAMLLAVALASVDICFFMYGEENQEELTIEEKEEVKNFLIDTISRELGL